jgi:hypothetical protein
MSASKHCGVVLCKQSLAGAQMKFSVDAEQAKLLFIG